MHDENVISWQVIDALREIEHTSTHDMYDRTRVIAAIHHIGMYEAAAWLAANRHLYFRMLARARSLEGFARRQERSRAGGALAALCR